MEAKKNVEYFSTYFSGWPKDVIPRLKVAVGIFKKSYKFVKIGITSNPENRFSQHKKHDKNYSWERMVVKYQTTSVANANAVEDHFIETDDSLVNIWTGYSHMTEKGPYHVYILLGNHKRRTRR